MAIFRLEGNDISNGELIIASPINIELEKHLETWLENSPRALIPDERVLWIGRQTSATDEGGTIYSDLIGVDSNGNLVIVELKKGKPDRDVIAQILDYAAWLDELTDPQIVKMAESYFESRNEYNGNSFQDVFAEFFEIPETEGLPTLKNHSRLYIIAEDIPPRLIKVCRFLRAKYGMEINCIIVSTFKTEADEILVNTEFKVGDEPIGNNKSYQSDNITLPRWSGEKPVKQIVKEAVLEITNKDKTYEFQLKDLRSLILSKHPDFNPNTVISQLYADCVNHPSRHHYPGGENLYWYVSRARYRLYDEKTDTINNTL